MFDFCLILCDYCHVKYVIFSPIFGFGDSVIIGKVLTISWLINIF